MTDRKAVAAAFRAAKPLLWDGVGEIPSGSHEYICFAVWETKCAAAKHAEEVIESRMGDRSSSLRLWLREKHGVASEEMTDARMQAYRHAWLDMLIAEFEGEEK